MEQEKAYLAKRFWIIWWIFFPLDWQGENKVTLLLLETADDIRHQAEILVGSEEVSGEPIRISRMTWVNPYCASFHVPGIHPLRFQNVIS